MVFKKCRNEGCEIIIEVRQTPEGWRPFLESGQMHQCQFSDYAKKQRGTIGTIQGTSEDKDDHGNEQTWSNETLKIRNPDNTGTDDLIPKYVDHTVARPSKVKIFHAENSDLVELAYNEFLKSKTFQWTRAQLGAKGNEFVIALYYEEMA